jgi:hypothetical protein
MHGAQQIKTRRTPLQAAKKVVLLKGTASAVPKLLCSQRGFSR